MKFRSGSLALRTYANHIDCVPLDQKAARQIVLFRHKSKLSLTNVGNRFTL